jgi:hypothetical protein
MGLTACGRGTIDSSQVAVERTSQGVVTNNIDRDYTLSYDENSGGGSFLASFTVSGDWHTTVRLSHPSQILFNGTKLHESQLMSQEGAVLAGIILPIFSPFFFLASGTHYDASVSTYALGRPQVVEWTDQHGRVFTDSLSVYGISNVSYQHQGKQFVVNVNIPSSSADLDDVCTARIEQKQADGVSRSITASSASGPIIFSSTDLARLISGPATLTVERSVRMKLNSRGSGAAKGTSSYTARSIQVTVD